MKRYDIMTSVRKKKVCILLEEREYEEQPSVDKSITSYFSVQSGILLDVKVPSKGDIEDYINMHPNPKFKCPKYPKTYISVDPLAIKTLTKGLNEDFEPGELERILTTAREEMIQIKDAL